LERFLVPRSKPKPTTTSAASKAKQAHARWSLNGISTGIGIDIGILNDTDESGESQMLRRNYKQTIFVSSTFFSWEEEKKWSALSCRFRLKETFMQRLNVWAKEKVTAKDVRGMMILYRFRSLFGSSCRSMLEWLTTAIFYSVPSPL